jgi:hypothetical protein
MMIVAYSVEGFTSNYPFISVLPELGLCPQQCYGEVTYVCATMMYRCTTRVYRPAPWKK